MPRHYPPEIHVGQKVIVHPAPGQHGIEAIITALDTVQGLVHVVPSGFNVKWAARPRAILSMEGFFLHYEKHQFKFKPTPSYN